MEDVGHAVQNTYVAHLGGPEVFGQKVWAEAQRRQWTQAWDTEVLGDGAPWIWNLADDHFYASLRVVDWYHATEHLGPRGGRLAWGSCVAGQTAVAERTQASVVRRASVTSGPDAPDAGHGPDGRRAGSVA